MRRLTVLSIFAVLVLAGCNQLAQQPSVRAYEDPQQQPAGGAVAVREPEPLPAGDAARMLENPFEMTTSTLAAGRRIYERYCWQCHGPKLDGDSSTVGPSFPKGRQNLLAPDIVALTEGELFVFVAEGTGKNPPMLGTVTHDELWQAITFVRAVQTGVLDTLTTKSIQIYGGM